MLDVRPCSVAEFFAHPDAPALLAEYAAESSIDGLPTPKPHADTYYLLEHSGRMHVFASYDGERMTGFLVLLCSLNPHYSAMLGVVESFFVASAHRKGGAGAALRREAKRAARDLGAVGLLVVAPFGGRLAHVLEADKACRETNRVFFEALV